MSDFTYENDVSTMSRDKKSGDVICAGGRSCLYRWSADRNDDHIAFGQNGLCRKRCDKMSACDTDAKVSRVHCSFTYVWNDQSVPCRGSVEKRNIFGKRGAPGNRSGVLSETDDQIVYSK